MGKCLSIARSGIKKEPDPPAEFSDPRPESSEPRHQRSIRRKPGRGLKDCDVEIFLMGPTDGHGRRSTGNTILGETHFKLANVRQTTSGWTDASGMTIKVVNFPSLLDKDTRSRLSPTEHLKQTEDNVKKGFYAVHCPKGFHALVLVLKYGTQFSEQEKEAVTLLKGMFGDDVTRKHCILVFTHGENFLLENPKTDFDKWCKKQRGDLRQLLDECCSRIVLFHNMTPDKADECNWQLIAKVRELQGRYTKQMFEKNARKQPKVICNKDAKHNDRPVDKDVKQNNGPVDKDVKQNNGPADKDVKQIKRPVDKDVTQNKRPVDKVAKQNNKPVVKDAKQNNGPVDNGGSGAKKSAGNNAGKDPWIKYERIKPGKPLGKGAFGTVYEGTLDGKKKVAVKEFRNTDQKMIDREAGQLIWLKHPNIVEIYGLSLHARDKGLNPDVYLVMELADNGSLSDALKTKPLYRDAISWGLQCAEGVAYFHSKSVVHRDLKPLNCLLFRSKTVLKICDFGLAREITKDMTKRVGTPLYIAPEVLDGKDYTESCDVYSWAIMMWELLTCEEPFGLQDPLTAKRLGRTPPPVKDVPSDLNNLMIRCFSKNPTGRPAMAQVVQDMKAFKDKKR